MRATPSERFTPSVSLLLRSLRCNFISCSVLLVDIDVYNLCSCLEPSASVVILPAGRRLEEGVEVIYVSDGTRLEHKSMAHSFGSWDILGFASNVDWDFAGAIESSKQGLGTTLYVQ